MSANLQEARSQRNWLLRKRAVKALSLPVPKSVIDGGVMVARKYIAHMGEVSYFVHTGRNVERASLALVEVERLIAADPAEPEALACDAPQAWPAPDGNHGDNLQRAIA